MKMRLTDSFRDAIDEAHRVFGEDDNQISKIVKRALRCFKRTSFKYESVDEKTSGNPITIENLNSELTSKEIQSITIQFLKDKIEWYNEFGKKPVQKQINKEDEKYQFMIGA